jgi:hypothetical protein
MSNENGKETYYGFFELQVVGHAQDGVVIVVECGFALQGQFVVGLEQFDSESRLRAIIRCGYPANSEKLVPLTPKSVFTAIAIVDGNVMNTRCIDDDKIKWSSLRAWTAISTMAKLYT